MDCHDPRRRLNTPAGWHNAASDLAAPTTGRACAGTLGVPDPIRDTRPDRVHTATSK